MPVYLHNTVTFIRLEASRFEYEARGSGSEGNRRFPETFCLFSSEDILVFLTGQEEIEAAAASARQVAKQLDGQGYPSLKVFPLYSALPTHQQLEAFKPSAPGMRKLILSTNVAETSVTIGGTWLNQRDYFISNFFRYPIVSNLFKPSISLRVRRALRTFFRQI